MLKSFKFPKTAGFASDATLNIQGDTSANVLEAIVRNKAFPAGKIALGDISATFSGKTDKITTGTGDVTLSVNGEIRLGVAILDEVEAVEETLQLASDEDEVALPIALVAGQRLAVLVA